MSSEMLLADKYLSIINDMLRSLESRGESKGFKPGSVGGGWKHRLCCALAADPTKQGPYTENIIPKGLQNQPS